MGMNINLTSKLEDMVRDKVASGLYTSASEVVREALRLMEEQDRLRAAGLEQLQSNIRERFSSSPVTTWSADDIKRATRNFLLWPNTR